LPGGAPLIQRFEHGGGTLVDEVIGGGTEREMVFLHGWGANRESLRGIAVLFENEYRIHLIDLPGFGEAPVPPSDWGTPNYTDLVHQFLLERVRGPIVLVGHSFGARVSLRLAARHLPQLRAIVLMGAPGLAAQGLSRKRARAWGIRALRQTLRALVPLTGSGPLEWHTGRFGSKDYLAAGPLRPILVRTVNEDLSECARQVDCPVLLLWGEEDTETPLWLAWRFSELMNGHATVRVLPHKDHFLYQGTGAHLCAFTIRQWLEHRDAR
jgi:pimeloyl-ACP methyl ester carboxylesterase